MIDKMTAEGAIKVEVIKVYYCKHCNRVLATLRGDKLDITCPNKHCGVANYFPAPGR